MASGRRFYILLYVSLAIVSALFVVTGCRAAEGFINLGLSDIEYVRAEVISMDNSQLAVPEYGGNRLTGLQTVKLKLLGGKFEGRTVDVENYLLNDFYVFPEKGETVIASVEDRGEGSPPYCLLVSHYRIMGIAFIVILFAVLHVATCGVKGLHALAGLAFTMVTIIFFTIPMIYNGHSPITMAIATGMITVAASLSLLNGMGRKTLVAILASFAGFSASGAAFHIFSTLANVSGYNVPQMGTLSYFSARTGLQVEHILFAGVLIASLGGVMDVSMSVASAVQEVHLAQPKLSRRRLYAAGLEVARDTSGTMSTTFILVFTGGSLSTLIAMSAYGIHLNQLFNSDFISVEIGQGLSASVALLLTAPFASLLASLAYQNQRS
jgi:uncharacterized membrane protein